MRWLYFARESGVIRKSAERRRGRRADAKANLDPFFEKKSGRVPVGSRASHKTRSSGSQTASEKPFLIDESEAGPLFAQPDKSRSLSAAPSMMMLKRSPTKGGLGASRSVA